jgi:hypothetical protein
MVILNEKNQKTTKLELEVVDEYQKTTEVVAMYGLSTDVTLSTASIVHEVERMMVKHPNWNVINIQITKDAE